MSSLASKLRRNVDDNVDQWSISASQSSTSTVHGLNTDSGRVIMKMGSLVLDGVEKLSIRRTLSRLSNEVREGNASSSTYRDLLELQRPLLYTTNVRRAAWSVLISAMGSEACSERCVQEVTTIILNWPQPDGQIFISQLSLFRHLGWPPNLPLGPESSKSSSLDRVNPILESPALSRSFSQIVAGATKGNHVPLSQLFTLTEFASLTLLTTSQVLSLQMISLPPLETLLNALLVVVPPIGQVDQSIPYEHEFRCFTQYLLDGPSIPMDVVVSHIVDSLRTFTRVRPQRRGNTEFVEILKSPQFVQRTWADCPPWPLLYLAARLCYENSAIAEKMCSWGILQVLHDLWESDCPPVVGRPLLGHQPRALEEIRDASLMLIGVLTQHISVAVIIDGLMQDGDCCFCRCEGFPRVKFHGSASGRLRARFFRSATFVTLEMLEQCFLSHGSHSLVKRASEFPPAFKYLITLLSADSSRHQDYDVSVKRRAARVLLCALTVFEPSWVHHLLIQSTRDNKLKLLKACSNVIDYCLHFAISMKMASFKDTVQVFRNMDTVAQSRSLKTSNAFYNFLSFFLTHIIPLMDNEDVWDINPVRVSDWMDHFTQGAFTCVDSLPISESECTRRYQDLNALKEQISQRDRVGVTTPRSADFNEPLALDRQIRLDDHAEWLAFTLYKPRL